MVLWLSKTLGGTCRSFPLPSAEAAEALHGLPPNGGKPVILQDGSWIKHRGTYLKRDAKKDPECLALFEYKWMQMASYDASSSEWCLDNWRKYVICGIMFYGIRRSRSKGQNAGVGAPEMSIRRSTGFIGFGFWIWLLLAGFPRSKSKHDPHWLNRLDGPMQSNICTLTMLLWSNWRRKATQITKLYVFSYSIWFPWSVQEIESLLECQSHK